ncbi:dephospho-CoA kinase [Shewanella sp. 1_MG-2023]|uniref:dephospho-CoA kinase n=1 Tax=unclassified Shewanella TaxID=196818 RepID=UPI0026E1C370|nr:MULTISPECIES: dephospho-CoA kinase [unclassified Shewanella]MDO6610545.1 dephospho-CoA kinase [Shewanella sp. 7_MG-2023]MDO6770670.1 dephospho-CoA kinase [Shewanella sp. 2_MG-2023]MDO6793312.1 dephospho-CoA kinase [Shewanella sp. 1_MG-2023]
MANFIVGLTGGIGSGKTTIANQFSELGIELVDADIIAREVVEQGTTGLSQIISRYGMDILDSSGKLDRTKLRSKVFDDEQERQWLNNLLHPLIRKKMLAAVKNANSPYVIMVVPLLFENGLDSLVNTTLVVDIPPHEQVARTAKRDGVNSTQVEKIINRQISRKLRLSKADAVIDNTLPLEEVRKTVQLLHSSYLDQVSTA